MKKKEFIGKEIRVIIWGRNEYSEDVQCSAKSFQSFDESPDFYFKNGNIHYIHRNPCVTWRAFKAMKYHYVFDTDGKCLSHQPKKFLNKRRSWDVRVGLPYAEFKVSDILQ